MQWIRSWGRKPALAAASQPELRQACYRLTVRGERKLRETRVDEMDPRVHDLLELCAQGAQTQQLRQCMPPRSLDATLRELMSCGWIEQHELPLASLQAPESQPGDGAFAGMPALQMHGAAPRLAPQQG